MSIKRNIKIIIFSLSLLFSPVPVIFSSTGLSGQEKTASPLNPESFQTQREVGLFLGIGPDFLSGMFRVSCDCPEFEDGTGLSWIGGLLYEQDIDEYFQWGGAIAINSMNVSSSYQIFKDRNFETSYKGNTYYDTLPVLFRQKADLSFLNFSIMPYIKWSPSKIFFIRLGIAAGFNISSNVLHTEEIINKIVKLPSTGENAEVTFTDGKSTATIEDGPYPEVVSPQFYFVPSAGFTIPLSTNIFLSPVIDYHFALTNMSSFGNGFNISSIYFMVELRWAIQLRQS